MNTPRTLKPLESDGQALARLSTLRFSILRGGIIKPQPHVVATDKELDAICYLVGEWDYGYEPPEDFYETGLR